MFKKSLASIVSAAILVAGPGHMTLTASAQTMRGNAGGVSVTPTIGTGLNSPVLSAPSFNAPALMPGGLISPALSVAPSVAPAPVAAINVAAAKPVALAAMPLAAAAKAVRGAAANVSVIAVIASKDAKVGVAEKGAALNSLFENSMVTGHESIEVLGQSAASVESGLSRSNVVSAKSPAAIEAANVEKGQAAGEAGIVSLIKRAWNAFLGMLGIGVKKMETPEVMAQRIIDQLNAQKPIYNRKVQEASTLVESLKLQIERDTAKVAELEQGITALLSDSDPTNDIQASGLINQQKTLNASIASSKEQVVLAAKTLEGIKEERARFFSDREEMLAKLQAGLTKSKSAEIQKQMAELKGGFQVGDLKDNMDKFEDAVNGKVADAKGTVDSVESNPDQILKKAKDSLKSQEIQDELAKRKAAIEQAKKDKGAAGGSAAGVVRALQAVSIGVNVLTAVWAGLHTGWVAMLLGAFAVSGLVIPLSGLGTIAGGVIAEKYLKTSGAKTVGAALVGAVAGVAAGVGLMAFAGYVGFAVVSPAAAVGLGVAALVSGLVSMAYKAFFQKKNAAEKTAGDDKGEAGGLLMELGIGAGVIALLAIVSKPFRGLLARAWNAALGMLGMGVKKMETPEVMAQRIIDQLNAQKPIYNRKVQEASTLVESLKLQVEKQAKESAELDRSVTAILSDSDPLNDVMAESLLNQKKTIDASMAINKEQVAIAEKTLEGIKEERARFFSDREEMLAKIQAGLTKSKSAEIQKQMAELKGGFQVGDLKDNMDKFEDAVNGKIADAKGTVDSVESNPDQILKKAKDSLKNQEVQDEIAKRKAAIEQAKKDKGQAGGMVQPFQLLSGFMAFVIAMVNPVTALAITAVFGLLTIGDDLISARRGKAFNNADKSVKFFMMAGGSALAAAIIFFVGAPGAAYVALAAAFAAVLGLVHKTIAAKKAASNDDKGQAGGAVGDETQTAAQAERGILSKTYSWMTLGLGITAAAAQAAIVTGAAAAVAASLPLMIGLAVAQLALVIGLSLAIRKISPGAALAGFLVYSALNGLFLAPLVAMFTVGSVAASFLVTAGMFGTMAAIGHTTKANLNSVGSYGMMALMGIILASIANMFLHSTGLGAILTYATILVFVGLTAYDAQKIKQMAQEEGKLSKDDVSRIAVMGALTLYLDFINLFIQILKLLGKAKSKD